MNRIDISFNKVKENKGKALIPFVTCGADFTVEETADLVVSLEKEGATVVEIGVPFRDPLADGPVIQNAYTKSLQNGTKVKDVFRCVELIREKCEVPVVLMVYFNVVYFNGIENFLKMAADSGVDGLIVPDVPLEERGDLDKICESNGIYLIPLVARTSKDRIAKITKDAKGFVYCVSTNGTTGERTSLDSGTHEYLEDVRNNKTDCSVQAIKDTYCICIGFDIVRSKLKRDCTFLTYICDYLSQKLTDGSNNSSINLLYPLENRLASFIVAFANIENETIKKFVFKENYTEIAELLGTSYRHLNRTLNKFCIEGILQKNNKEYIIKDYERILYLAGDLYK